MDYKKLSNTHAETKLYGYIGSWLNSGDSFTSFLDSLEASGYTDLTIRWHCFGGSVFEGNVIYNALQRTKLKVTIVIDGIAASMGCFILPAVEEVVIADNGFGMIHRPSSDNWGDADVHKTAAKLLEDMEKTFIDRLVERTKLTAEDIKAKWLDGKDHWLNADEMVSYGFAKKKIPATAISIKELDKEAAIKAGVEGVYNQFSASFTAQKESQNSQQKLGNMNKELLIATFGIEGVTAESSDTAIIAALKAKFDSVESALKEIKTKAESEKNAKIASLIKLADAEGKIVPVGGQKKEELVKVYENIGKSAGVEALEAIFAGTQKKRSITSQMQNHESPANATECKNWDWYQKNDPSALEKLVKEDNDLFRELYKAHYGEFPA